MKKTILILLILITTGKWAFATDTLDDLKLDSLSDKVFQINLIKDNEQKVKEWAKLNAKENYVIINKKTCSASVCDKNGSKIKSFEVGIGKEIGDDFNDTEGKVGRSKNTTPAGEFILSLSTVRAGYGDTVLSLGLKAKKSKNTKKLVAMHRIPDFRLKDRKNKFYDGNLANNRMTHGCINLIEKDFKELTKYIHGGAKIYVLPEESDNYLMLSKGDNGEYEFIQTKY